MSYKIACPLCKSDLGDSQEHMYNCIIMKISCRELFRSTEAKYDDIFSNNINKLIEISKICESLARKRSELIS